MSDHLNQNLIDVNKGGRGVVGGLAQSNYVRGNLRATESKVVENGEVDG